MSCHFVHLHASRSFYWSWQGLAFTPITAKGITSLSIFFSFTLRLCYVFHQLFKVHFSFLHFLFCSHPLMRIINSSFFYIYISLRCVAVERKGSALELSSRTCSPKLPFPPARVLSLQFAPIFFKSIQPQIGYQTPIKTKVAKHDDLISH